MEQNLLCPPNSLLRNDSPRDTANRFAGAPSDHIFMQDLGMLPKRIVSPGRVGPTPVPERKWLGTDFSHVIVSQ